MELNRSFIYGLNQALECSSFSADDFAITCDDESSIFKISFLHEDKFLMIAKDIEYEKESKISKELNSRFPVMSLIGNDRLETKYFTDTVREIEITMKPGVIKGIDKYTVDNLDKITGEVKKWCVNIERELRFIYADKPIYDESIEKQIDEFFPEEMPNPEEYFKDEELEKLSEGIEKLKAMVRNLQKKCRISEDRIQALETALDKAESDASIFPKGAWLRFNKSKMKNGFKKIMGIPEVRQGCLEIMKHYLLK